MPNPDEKFMRLALKEAAKAGRKNEVPIGAVLVLRGKVIARGHNQSITKKDASAHAEIEVLRKAGRALQNYRLGDTILYTTVEPCAMCAGALLWARISKVVFGCPDAKAGACGSVLDLSNHKILNHRFTLVSGVLTQECKTILQNFFKTRRRSTHAGN